jgi:cation diffusion facilitator CzcD-associated flavoprotein CzcO
MTVNGASNAAPTVLLHGQGGASTADLAFLEPMLARRGAVSTVRPEQLDDVAILPNTTLVAFGEHSVGALRAGENSGGLIARVVLVDPKPDGVDPDSTLLPVLVIGAGRGFIDGRRMLREQPARVLSLIEAFADPVPVVHEPRVPATGIRSHPQKAMPGSPGLSDIDTVIVGAGFAGLGMGIQLARRGVESFVILERAGDVGGTWRDNVYPGVACDIPSHLYSFSFLPKPDWSSFFADGAEIHEYLREAARSEGLERHLRLGCEVLEMRWNELELRWRVSTAAGEYRCRTLVVAAGRLSDARLPAIPGLDTFAGTSMHSSAWDHRVELAGKRIGVVGTGASAAQLVPRLAQTAKRVVVFQRSAPYVVPRPDRRYSDEEQLAFELMPSSRESLRDDLFWGAETAFAERMRVPGVIDRLRERALGHLRAHVADPALRAAATPDYEIGCKRVVISNDYYPAIASPAVTLEPSALAEIDGQVARAANGSAHELDVLVFATGFESTRPPFAERTIGVDRQRLSEAWADGMTAHASTTVHGFPNLFVLDGPNASLGHNSAVLMIEAQIDYVLGAFELRERSGVEVLDVKRAAQDAYRAEIDAKAASSVWLTGGCASWYVDERSGRLTLLWPDFAYAFQRRLARFDPESYDEISTRRLSAGGNDTVYSRTDAVTSPQSSFFTRIPSVDTSTSRTRSH